MGVQRYCWRWSTVGGGPYAAYGWLALGDALERGGRVCGGCAFGPLAADWRMGILTIDTDL